MDFHDFCLLGGILFLVAGFTVFYAAAANLDAWRGDASNRSLMEQEIFGSQVEHFEARRKITELRLQRWRSTPWTRWAVYSGLLLMLCGAFCFWLR